MEGFHDRDNASEATHKGTKSNYTSQLHWLVGGILQVREYLLVSIYVYLYVCPTISNLKHESYIFQKLIFIL